MDAVSQAIIEVAHSAHSAAALNIVHPRPISWASIISSINDALVQEGVLRSPLPVVDMQSWVSKLKAHAANSSSEILSDIVSSILPMETIANVAIHLLFTARNQVTGLFRLHR